ncbi:MAG: extracellular solute-binding protein, partial [Clostridiales bacterium]|nr:extracellular solute-binding protein [Clostridiales bacterium]
MKRRLLATLLALMMALALIPMGAAGAEAEPYTLVYYWIGNGDTDQRPLVEQAINDYIGPILNAKVDFHIIGWGDWATKALTAIQAGEKIDIFFTADWQQYMRSVQQQTFLL